MADRRLSRIGDRYFVMTVPDDFPGGAAEFVAWFVPFGLHLVDIAGLDSIDAGRKLYQFLVVAGFECQFVAAGLHEEDRRPTREYAAEVAAYLESLTEAGATKMRRMIAVGMVHSMVLSRNGTTFLQAMRQNDPRCA